MEKLLSIIIPTYNMEAYLNRCLDSLLVGELQETLDILVVNDGSKDRSSEIAHTYADRFPNSFRVIDKPNGNYGSCINAALPLAVGKYVKVLDSDDYFDTKALLTFLERLKGIDTDAVFADYVREYSDTGRKELSSLDYMDGEVFSPDERVLFPYEMHHLAYKTSLLREVNYVQTEGISYTDTEWCFYPLFKVRNYTYLKLSLYQYQLGREGQTMEASVFRKNIYSLDVILEKMLDAIIGKASALSASRKKYCDEYIYSRLTIIYTIELMQAGATNVEIMKRIDQKLKAYDMEMYGALEKPFLRRFYVRLFRCGVVLPEGVRRIRSGLIAILKR